MPGEQHGDRPGRLRRRRPASAVPWARTGLGAPFDFASPRAPVGIPRSGASSSAGRPPTASTARRSCARFWGEVDPALRRLQSAVAFRTAAPRPNWGSYRYARLSPRRLLERAGCHRGADAIYICGGRSTLVSTRDHCQFERLRASSSSGPPPTAASRWCVFSFRKMFSEKILGSGDFDLVSSPGSTSDGIVGQKDSTASVSPNYTGYCQRLVTAHLNQADRIFDTEQRARVLNGPTAGSRRDGPVIPLYQIRRLLRVQETSQEDVVRFGRIVSSSCERGGLVARPTSPRVGARRRAPRGLGSGRGVRADPEARRHRRVRSDASFEPGLSQSCRPLRCAPGTSQITLLRVAGRGSSSGLPFDVVSGLHVWRPRLVSNVLRSRGSRRSRSRTAFAPQARWSDGTPLSRRGTSSSTHQVNP